MPPGTSYSQVPSPATLCAIASLVSLRPSLSAMRRCSVTSRTIAAAPTTLPDGPLTGETVRATARRLPSLTMHSVS